MQTQISSFSTPSHVPVKVKCLTFPAVFLFFEQFFGFIAAAVYGYDSFLKYHAYQDGEIAQGERTVQVAGGSSQA